MTATWFNRLNETIECHVFNCIPVVFSSPVTWIGQALLRVYNEPNSFMEIDESVLIFPLNMHEAKIAQRKHTYYLHTLFCKYVVSYHLVVLQNFFMNWKSLSLFLTELECHAPCQLIVKFIYSEKVTKFCEIFTIDLSHVVPVKYAVEISHILGSSQNIWTLRKMQDL